MKTRLRLIFAVLAFATAGAQPVDTPTAYDPTREIATLNRLADLFENSAAMNRLTASLFFPNLDATEARAAREFTTRAQIYTDVAARVRAEIQYQFPNITPQSPTLSSRQTDRAP